MRKFLALLALALPLAFAQRIVISPEAIVVNPNPAPNFTVTVSLNKSGSRPVYQMGESVQISVRVSQSAYVYLFSVKPDGEITQILPNRYDPAGQSNLMNAGESRTFPPANARYSFTIAPPKGLSKVIAVASKRQLDTREIAQFKSGDTFASGTGGQDGFVHGFAIVVKPVPQQDWVTSTALYYVGNEPQQPAFGNLRIDSSPRQAEAFIDGDFVGYTPTNFGTHPGRHDIRITKDGYEAFQTSVNLRPGETQSVHAQLQPIQRTGTVSFDSAPRGAQVYLDGNYVGTTPTGRMSVDAGSHTARFTLPGYQEGRVSFELSSGEDRQVSTGLQRASGTLIIQANVGGAMVFIDGRQIGTIPSGSGRLSVPDLEPGQHELTLVAPGFRSYVSGFTIISGRTAQLSANQSHL
jgi:hypothetical protein